MMKTRNHPNINKIINISKKLIIYILRYRMPKNKKKGKNAKNKGVQKETRALILREPMQEYAKITKLLGDRRVMMTFPDGNEVLGIIPGRFRKRIWMKPGDIVLCSAREFQEDRYDIIHKFNDSEPRKLVKQAEVPTFFLDCISTISEENDCGIKIGLDSDCEGDSSDSNKKEELNFDDI